MTDKEELVRTDSSHSPGEFFGHQKFIKLVGDLKTYIIANNHYPELLFADEPTTPELLRGREFSCMAGHVPNGYQVISVTESRFGARVPLFNTFGLNEDNFVTRVSWLDKTISLGDEQQYELIDCLFRGLRGYLDAVKPSPIVVH